MWGGHLLLPLLIALGEAADTLKGVMECMNHEECLGANRECSFQSRLGEGARVGRCVCKEGYTGIPDNFACRRQEPPVEVRETCRRDEDCRLGEICMSWQYDPGTDTSRKLRSGLSPTSRERHQLCIDAWVIQQHMANLDEPRTGGGLRSHRRDSFNADEYFFGGRRPPRVHQQYIGFAEDMMLILFLVCILATLVTVHRATCYRQFQEARRSSPLRHLLPIPEDRPPPYSHARGDDSVDGTPEVVCSSSAPKRVSETPPPSYEEALYRNSVRLPGVQTEVPTSRAVVITLEDNTSSTSSTSPPSFSSLPSSSPTPTGPAPQATPPPSDDPPPQLVADTAIDMENNTNTTSDTTIADSNTDNTITITANTNTEGSMEESAGQEDREEVTVDDKEVERKEQEAVREEQVVMMEEQVVGREEQVVGREEQEGGGVAKEMCSVVVGQSSGPVIPV